MESCKATHSSATTHSSQHPKPGLQHNEWKMTKLSWENIKRSAACPMSIAERSGECHRSNEPFGLNFGIRHSSRGRVFILPNPAGGSLRNRAPFAVAAHR